MVFFSIVSTIALTGFATISAVFYNLISDVVGGLEFVVLEEIYEPPRPTDVVRPSRQPATPSVNGPLQDLPTQETPVST